MLGKTIILEGEQYTVIGVTPTGFRFPRGDADVWVPLESELKPENLHNRGSHYLNVLAKLRQDVTVDQARTEMNRICAGLNRAYPDANIEGALVLSLKDEVVQQIRPALLVLLAAVGCLLLIACANVANLLLVRARVRQKEISLRAPLGASQGRVMRQLITESLLLSLCGGAAGVLLAQWSRSVLLKLSPASLPQINAIQTNFRVLAFAFLVSTVTGVLFGLVPALNMVRMDLHENLKSGGRAGGTHGEGTRPRSMLVVGEVALSLVLLIGAGLLIKSFVRLLRADTGFRGHQVITMQIGWLPEKKYVRDQDVATFYRKLLEKISTLPGVASVGATSYLPLTGHNFDNAFTVEGQPPLPPGVSQFALMRMVDPHYFRILGIPLQRGRIFSDQDRARSAPVVIISQSMARRYWPGADALGKRMTILMGDNPKPSEVVGIVADVRSDINADPEPTMYVPYQQFPVRSMALAVKAFSDPTGIVEEVRRAVRELDPDELVSDVRTPGELLAESVVPWRFSMLLVGSFAALALVLATVGIFGVVSYTVGQRTHEIGVRMALGARQGDVLKLILGQSSLLVLVGVGIGLVAALNLTRLMSSLLYGVRPTDTSIFSAASFLLTAVTLLASYIPADGAAKVDPMVALRYE